MRISHICPFVGEQMGGSERYVVNLSKKQSGNHEVHIYTTTRHFQNSCTRDANGVTIHRFYAPFVFWNMNPFALMLRRLVNSNSDIFHIHSYLFSTSNQAVLAKLLRKGTALLQIHGGIGLPPYRTSWLKIAAKQFYDNSLGRFTIENSDAVASVSRVDLDYIKANFSIPSSRLFYIPNTVDTEIFHPSGREGDADDNVLLYVGDLEPWKGIGSIVRWIKSCESWDGENLTFRFVGQGSCLDQIASLARFCERNGGRINIEILGQREHHEIPSLMRDAKALIFPSYWEGQPTVILEAMASGLPVISTAVGDIPNFLGHLKTGFLIDRTVASFTDALRMVFHEGRLVKRIVKNARDLILEEFSLERVSETVRRIYIDLCKDRCRMPGAD